MINYLLAFFVSFLAVFLKVFQQKNVIHDKINWVIPTSMFMALSQVLITFVIIKESIWIFLPIGFGGGLAAVLAILIYNKIK